MEDCLTLILDMNNGIYINKRLYIHFIKILKEHKEWLYKCKVVFYLVHKYKRKEYRKYVGIQYLSHLPSLINKIAPYDEEEANILYNALRKCNMCDGFKDQCNGKHKNASDYF